MIFSVENVLFLIFFGIPVAVFAAGVLLMENRDTSSPRWSRGGKNDPFRYIAYTHAGHIRRWFRPVVLTISVIYLVVLIAIVVWFGD